MDIWSNWDDLHQNRVHSLDKQTSNDHWSVWEHLFESSNADQVPIEPLLNRWGETFYRCVSGPLNTTNMGVMTYIACLTLWAALRTVVSGWLNATDMRVTSYSRCETRLTKAPTCGVTFWLCSQLTKPGTGSQVLSGKAWVWFYQSYLH